MTTKNNLIVQRDGVEFRFESRRHVCEGLLRSARVRGDLGRLRTLHLKLNRGFQIECLDQTCLFEHGTVADGAHIHAIGVGSNGQFWMVPDALVDDLRDRPQGRTVLLHAVMAQSNVVRQIGLVAHCVERFSVLVACLLEQTFLERDGRIIDDHIRFIRVALIQIAFTR